MHRDRSPNQTTTKPLTCLSNGFPSRFRLKIKAIVANNSLSARLGAVLFRDAEGERDERETCDGLRPCCPPLRNPHFDRQRHRCCQYIAQLLLQGLAFQLGLEFQVGNHTNRILVNLPNTAGDSFLFARTGPCKFARQSRRTGNCHLFRARRYSLMQ